MGAVLEFFVVPSGLRLPQMALEGMPLTVLKRAQGGVDGIRANFDARLRDHPAPRVVNLLASLISDLGRHVESLTINSSIIADFEQRVHVANLDYLLRSPPFHGRVDRLRSCGWVDCGALPTTIQLVKEADIEEMADVAEWLKDAEWSGKNVATIWT